MATKLLKLAPGGETGPERHPKEHDEATDAFVFNKIETRGSTGAAVIIDQGATGAISILSGKSMVIPSAPVNTGHLANKTYVDTQVSTITKETFGTGDGTIAQGDALGITGAFVQKASATNLEGSRFVGIADAAPSGGTVDVITYGESVVPGALNLVAGDRAFLSTVAAGLTGAAPTNSGNAVILVGKMKTSTTLIVMPDFIGIRT